MKGDRFPLVRLVLFMILSLIDLFLTWYLFEFSDLEITESNPIAAAWLGDYGWTGLLLFKSLILVVGLTLIVLISRPRPDLGGKVASFACLVLTLVTLYSSWLAYNTVR